ncbi:MAG: hypothetical protein BWK80_15180 [Desulfobacteraceae bacterium IS3]|nr:MAG: hypothetical protein BWK80_15180 [Desulfobacteraceae bacterium IS3]
MKGENREKGKLVRWNDEKGYGFIRPYKGNNEDIFFHVKSLQHYQRRPQINDILTYDVALDENQKCYACDAKIEGVAWSIFTVIWLVATLLFGIYVYFVIRQLFPFHPLAVYAAMSLLTIRAYSRDKSAAQSGKRRTPEIRLHLLEMLGGWPGALLAQWNYRHKSQKLSYRVVFWMIVVSHCVVWYYILTHQEIYRHYREAVTENVRSFAKISGSYGHVAREDFRSLVNQAEEQVLHFSEKINSKDMQTGYDHEEISEKAAKGGRSTIPPEISERQSIRQVKTDRRSIIIPDRQLRVVKGVVKEIRPQEGVIVSLQSGTESIGIIDKSTLIDNFSAHFTPGERIQAAIHKISMEGNRKYIELILVEK